MPPETIKDSMDMGLQVPNYFIVPTQRFETRLGLSVAEFEFPAYFNFFVLKKRVNLIVDKVGEKAIRTIFQETLLGPKDVSTVEEEMDESMPSDARVNLRKELDFFAKNPFNHKEKLTFDTLINIINFDPETNEVTIPNPEDKTKKIKIVKKFGYFELWQKDLKIATFNDEVIINGKEYPASKNLVECCYHEIKGVQPEKEEIVIRKEAPELIINQNLSVQEHSLVEENIKAIEFRPPDFGFTVLGNSHGFDHTGSTSGFIIWINKKGIMVDPPPFTSKALRKMDIPPNLIDKIILTHCHSDHDAGAFQKVLDAGTIEIITTETIMGSFSRKYAATMGVEIGEVMSLFEFRPICIGRDILLHGAKFKFFYAFHSVPTIGFEISHGGKCMYFSGDTFYDPEKLKEIYEMGVFGEGRYKQLAQPNWSKYDLIIHESGVPPIHTPLSVLAELPDEIKNNVRVYHIASKDFKPETGLKYCSIGLTNTEVLVEKAVRNPTLSNLEIVSQIELLNQLPLKRITDLIRCLNEEQFSEGEFIIREGTKGRKFYLIKEGICRLYSRKTDRKFMKLKYSGDYFGESAVTSHGIRNATVIAHTDCTLLSIDKKDFQFCFGTSKKDGNNRMTLFGRIDNLRKIRLGEYAQLIEQNSILENMTELQKNEFTSRMIEKEIKKGDILWGKGLLPGSCFILIKGEMVMLGSLDLGTIKIYPGHFVGDFPYLLNNKTCKTAVRAITDCVILEIDKGDFVDLLRANPGLLVFFNDKYIVE